MIHVMIAGNNPIYCMGLLVALDDEENILPSYVNHMSDLAGLIKTEEPDVILLDLSLSVSSQSGKTSSLFSNKVETVNRVKASGYRGKIIVITEPVRQKEFRMMLHCGIDGYVTMHEKPADLVKIIQSVMDDDVMIIKKSLLLQDDELEENNTVKSKLSKRERQVMDLLRFGMTNREISKETGLGEGTVRNLLSAIYVKLNVSNRTEALSLMFLDEH